MEQQKKKHTVCRSWLFEGWAKGKYSHPNVFVKEEIKRQFQKESNGTVLQDFIGRCAARIVTILSVRQLSQLKDLSDKDLFP